MLSIRKSFAAAMITAAAITASAVMANASAFYGFQVVDVPHWDTLNVRAWPSAQSKILVAYPNGTMLSLTGRCTGGINLGAIAGWPAWKQRQAIRYQWCEAYVDPYGNGQYRSGWVYGKYLRPL